MDPSKGKLTRSRNPLKKEAKLHQIITVGTKLFIRDGDHMSMRELAQEVGLVVSGLYRYFQNKRELWFACNNHEFAKFSNDYAKIESDHSGEDALILMKYGAYFLELAHKDFPLFKFMFLSTPPPSKKGKGPFELQHYGAGFTNLYEVITRLVKTGNYSETNSLYLALSTWGFVLGPSIITSPLFTHFFEGFPVEKFDPDEYRAFVLQLIQKIYRA